MVSVSAARCSAVSSAADRPGRRGGDEAALVGDGLKWLAAAGEAQVGSPRRRGLRSGASAAARSSCGMPSRKPTPPSQTARRTHRADRGRASRRGCRREASHGGAVAGALGIERIGGAPLDGAGVDDADVEGVLAEGLTMAVQAWRASGAPSGPKRSAAISFRTVSMEGAIAAEALGQIDVGRRVAAHVQPMNMALRLASCGAGCCSVRRRGP